MSFDRSAAERLASDCAASMHEAARRFSAGIQELLDHAAAEAARERQQILEESTALARERQRLEEAWQHLNLERARMEAGGPVSSGHKPNLYPSPRETEQEASLSTSRFSTVAGGPIPNHYIVTVADRAYTVLPLKEPNASSLGHELWNHVVEVPEGWEVLSSQMEGFYHAISVLGQQRWGAMVLGVRNARRGFDAYWTPLFGDGSFAAQLCEADVDWIEPAGPAEEPQRRFRMTYSGLRLVIRKANQSFQATGAKQATAGPQTQTPRMQVAYSPGQGMPAPVYQNGMYPMRPIGVMQPGVTMLPGTYR